MRTLSQEELDKTVQAIIEFRVQHGYYPTLRDLANVLGLRGVAPVHARVSRLEQAGLLRRHPANGMIIWCGDVATP